MSRRLFLRGMGLIYLAAFASLWTQVIGLIGGRGILPVAEFLPMVREHFGARGYGLAPTLCWLNTGDAFLHLLCGGGALLSILLVFGLAPAPVLFLLWAFYLSLTVAGREFMSFQWDALLLEAGFLAVFLAPLKLSLRRAGSAPSPLVVWLVRWLLFRLTFSSGLVKLLSGDAAWRGLSALCVHYETQPLPTVLGWAAHQLPAACHTAACAGMFVIELLVPFTAFGPRRVRAAGCALMVFLQALILLTGNYAFFNWLTILLCLTLLDGPDWSIRPRAGSAREWPRWVVLPVAALVLALSALQMSALSGLRFRLPAVVDRMVEPLLPLRIVNGYGLFAVMTTSRTEIQVEGSNDGVTWLPYEFRFKPGDVKRMPGFVAPHQPRLDWQMWFAALGSWRDNPWFANFCARLLEGEPAVLGLLRKNPFPGAPPRHVRALAYDYRFTDWKTLRREGAWWRTKLVGAYSPT